MNVRWLTPDEARLVAPGLDLTGVRGATYCPDDGVADPHGVTQGFAKGAQARGVEIVRETEVTGVRLERNRVAEVRTSRGNISTPIVVNAAGPWAKSIGRMLGVDVPVEPERRHIFIAQAPSGGSWDDEPHAGLVPASKVLVIDFESTFYFHREGKGLLFGMGDPDELPGFDITVRWDFLPKVIEVAVRRLPALADAAVSHAWAGLYEMTPGSQPDHRAVGGHRRFLLHHRLQRPRVPALACGRPHSRRPDRRSGPEVRSQPVRVVPVRRPHSQWRSQHRVILSRGYDEGRMGLSAGTRFGRYEIQGLLGAGGMGELYRARDDRLGRDVAIKILPDTWLADPDRRARFDREARLLAQLNHLHVASIYGLEEREGSLPWSSNSWMARRWPGWAVEKRLIRYWRAFRRSPPSAMCRR